MEMNFSKYLVEIYKAEWIACSLGSILNIINPVIEVLGEG